MNGLHLGSGAAAAVLIVGGLLLLPLLARCFQTPTQPQIERTANSRSGEVAMVLTLLLLAVLAAAVFRASHV